MPITSGRSNKETGDVQLQEEAEEEGQAEVTSGTAGVSPETPSPVRRVDIFSPRVKGGRGYLMIDNRASGGTLEERDTMTCSHCSCVVVLNPKRVRPRAVCFRCNAYVCDDKKCAEECYSMARCLELVVADPSIPALPRAADGGLLFDPALLEKGRPY